jgi:hypothetical protein
MSLPAGRQVTRFNMIAKIIINILLIIGLGAAQMAFISGLPGPFNNLNLVLVILIFILGFTSFNFAVSWTMGMGFMLEVFLFLPFGVYLVSLILMIIIASFLLDYFFTNRSLYSFLALVFLSTIIYELIISSLAFIFMGTDANFFPASLDFWQAILKQIGFNLLATVFIYYLVHFFGNNLQPVFLTRNKK